MPTEILAERDRLPVGFMEQVIEYRRMAEAIAMVKGATTPDAVQALPDSPLVDLARIVEFELAQEEMNEG